MNLQFGCKKCDKLHIRKSQYDGISPTVTIDSEKEDIFLKKNMVVLRNLKIFSMEKK